MQGLSNQTYTGRVDGGFPGQIFGTASDVAAAKPQTPLDVLLARVRNLAMRSAHIADGLDASLAVLTGSRASLPGTNAGACASATCAPGAPGRIEELQSALDSLEGTLRHIEAVADAFRGSVG
ncbi:hypothetical protein AB4Z01_15015 [Inquilinus sp. YAF38]|uniref:hypothetical protein n=1 Tax=Inquilinus sp. YAF38 TaxID=3233084 RepID=UPI003F8F5FBF